jgi:hypothetical protein
MATFTVMSADIVIKLCTWWIYFRHASARLQRVDQRLSWPLRIRSFSFYYCNKLLTLKYKKEQAYIANRSCISDQQPLQYRTQQSAAIGTSRDQGCKTKNIQGTVSRDFLSPALHELFLHDSIDISNFRILLSCSSRNLFSSEEYSLLKRTTTRYLYVVRFYCAICLQILFFKHNVLFFSH